MKREPEPKSATSGFKWVLYNVAEEIPPLSDSSIAFRNMLTRLIVDNIRPDTKRYYQKGRFSYLCRPLVKIRPKQIMNHVQPDDKNMILSCLVSCLFMKGEAYLCQNDITTTLSTPNSIPTLCEYIFKTEYGLIKKSVKGILIQEVFQQIHYFHHSPKKILHGCIAYFIRRAKNHLKWLY